MDLLRQMYITTCCHTEIEVADQTFYLTHSQYSDSRKTSLNADPITPGSWQGSHWNAIRFRSLVWLGPEKFPWKNWEPNLGSSVLEADALTTGRRGNCLGGEAEGWGGGGGGGDGCLQDTLQCLRGALMAQLVWVLHAAKYWKGSLVAQLVGVLDCSTSGF